MRVRFTTTVLGVTALTLLTLPSCSNTPVQPEHPPPLDGP